MNLLDYFRSAIHQLKLINNILADKENNTLITAHRGASGEAPENTIASITKALDYKSDIIEIDVQETKDGEVVLHHDFTLKRTAKIQKLIANLTLNELGELEVGSWFDSKFKGEKIPTLNQVIELINGKALLNIELKSGIHQQQLAEKVESIITDLKLFDDCFVTSFDFSLIEKVKSRSSQIKTGYIFSMFSNINPHIIEKVDIVSVNHRFLSKKLIRYARERKKEIHVWTVNKEKEMTRLIGMGVDSIITNFPDIAIKLRDNYD
ncbi:MAG: glycerophosphodiester phosphodiesterase family protein [Ignavibacteria bacterium]|nr:glycerophosphodiester phosphodiesterase family protein [Ignavibacteria bacterium]